MSYGCLINQLRSHCKHSTSCTALITIKNGRDLCGNELLNTFPAVNIQNRAEDFEILTEKCESHKVFTSTYQRRRALLSLSALTKCLHQHRVVMRYASTQQRKQFSGNNDKFAD